MSFEDEWKAERKHGFPPNIQRWKRLISAVPYDYGGRMASYGSMENIAERFGYKNRHSAKRAHYRAKCTLRRYD